MQTKKELRKEILQKRMELTSEEVQELSEKICNNVKELQVYKDAHNVCLYMPVNNEVDTTSLIEDAWNNGKNVWLPKTDGRKMDFMKFDQNTPLSEGSYKILEPASHEALEPDSKTLILMPGVAFSMDGGRLGYGGGYYDRYLGKGLPCTTASVCYEFQIVESVPTEAHDFKPDYIISENNTGKVD